MRLLVTLHVEADIWGNGIVNTTPALVPTHSKSLHASSEVTLKQAALCCRIMSSQPASIYRNNIRQKLVS